MSKQLIKAPRTCLLSSHMGIYVTTASELHPVHLCSYRDQQTQNCTVMYDSMKPWRKVTIVKVSTTSGCADLLTGPHCQHCHVLVQQPIWSLGLPSALWFSLPAQRRLLPRQLLGLLSQHSPWHCHAHLELLTWRCSQT